MSFGFENPIWLLGAALIGPLIWLYLRTRPRPPAVVSSLMLWRQIPEAPTPRRRPKLPLLFFLQALLILASALAVAGPFRLEPVPPGRPRDAIIVLDVSASMQTRDGSGTRFTAARDAAAKRAEELAAGPQGRRVTVVAAGLRPAVVATSLDGATAATTIAALEPVDTGANLTAAIELGATLAGREGSLDVFTDEPPEQIVLSHDARAASAIHRFGEGGSNNAISSVRVQANPFDASQPAQMLIALRSFSNEASILDLEVAPLENGEPIHRNVTLAPGSSAVVSIDDVAWKGAFSARLQAGDDFALDDVAYGYVPERNPTEVLLVTADERLGRELSAIAKQIGTFHLQPVTPEQYDPKAAAEITLFDRFVPSTPPPGSVAYFAPSKGNSDVTTFAQTAKVRLVEKRDHEILRGVENPETLLGSELVGLAPGALHPLLVGRSEGRDIAVAQAGVVGDRRIAVTGFRIDPTALRSADGLPTLIFTLNLLSWLAPPSPDTPLLRTTGERLRGAAKSALPVEKLVGPDGEHPLAPTEDTTLERAGIYDAIAEGSDRRVLVSFADSNESDIRRPPLDATKASGQKPTARQSPPSEESAWTRISFLPAFLMIILAVMIAEWLLLAGSASGSKQAGAEG